MITRCPSEEQIVRSRFHFIACPTVNRFVGVDAASVSVIDHLVFEVDVQGSGEMDAELNHLTKGNSDLWLLLVLNMGDAPIVFSRKDADQGLVNLLAFGGKENVEQVVQYPGLPLQEESLDSVGVSLGIFIRLFLLLLFVLLKLAVEGFEEYSFVCDVFLAFLLELVDIFCGHNLVGSIHILLLQQLFLQFNS